MTDDSIIPIRRRSESLLHLPPDGPEIGPVLVEVAKERARQIELGWTPEHDQRHRVDGLVRMAKNQIHKTDPNVEEGYYSRKRIVQAAALLVAAIERLDAADRAGEL